MKVEGWVCVPREATRTMCARAVTFANGDAVYKNVAAAALEIEERIYGEAYEAMLSAAPTPSPVPVDADELEGLRRDAARYRFIRDVPWFGSGRPLAKVIGQQRNAHWDSSIDAALAANGEKP